MDFCHIAPTPHLNLVEGRATHLVLAHLVERDPDYVDFYKRQKEQYNCTIILDNSAFEMYKQRQPYYQSEKLVEIGKIIGADYIVMSDYPNQRSQKTIESAIELAPIFRSEGFGTFFVPQSRADDMGNLLDCFKWASTSDDVDYIGVSILAVPNAYNNEHKPIIRTLTRWHFMHLLNDNSILRHIYINQKKIHFLGMLDGPNEILLMRDFAPYITSWDSSAAIWAGLHGLKFSEKLPLGIRQKFELEVDFNFRTHDDMLIQSAHENMFYIENLVNYIDNLPLSHIESIPAKVFVT
jgi:hypothetical protein